MIEADAELQKFLDRRTSVFSQALENLIQSRLGKGDYGQAISDLARLLQKTMILSDLHGRKRALMEVDRIKRQIAKFTLPDTTPIKPGVPFEEAIEDLVSREPRLAESARQVSDLYDTEHVFAMARSIDLNVTKKVQEIITGALKEGKGLSDVEELIAQTGDWSISYAANIFRTNANTAYTQGRFEQMKDPEVANIMPAFEYVGVDDARTRPNHLAAFGLIASVDDAIWRTYKPPMAWQCRCGVIGVSIFELESKGLIRNGRVMRYLPPNFADAHPDPGFRPGGIAF